MYGSVKSHYMLETLKTINSVGNTENFVDELVMTNEIGNQQATCESRESSTTTRETSTRRYRNGTEAWYKVPETELKLVEAHLLGDGCLYRLSPTRNAKFVLCRGNDFRAYTEYTWNRLPTLRSSAIGKVKRSRLAKQTNAELYNYQFSTRVHPELTKLHTKWYQNGKKKLAVDPEDITDSQLAIWWCDDGTVCYTTGHKLSYGALATCNFTIEENVKIVSWLQRKGLDCVLKNTIPGKRLVAERGYKPLPYIYLRKKGILQLSEIIKPHVPPCMSYKLAG